MFFSFLIFVHLFVPSRPICPDPRGKKKRKKEYNAIPKLKKSKDEDKKSCSSSNHKKERGQRRTKAKDLEKTLKRFIWRCSPTRCSEQKQMGNKKPTKTARKMRVPHGKEKKGNDARIQSIRRLMSGKMIKVNSTPDYYFSIFFSIISELNRKPKPVFIP